MLYETEGFRRRCLRRFSAIDITLVIAVRAHAKNPWVIERLRVLAGYYDPSPEILVVDFGSEAPYQTQIESVCRDGSMRYLYVDDPGVFWLAKARNVGAAAATTDLLFFSDVDCFGERDLFARLVQTANTQNFGAQLDQVLILPVYHLAMASSADFFDAAGSEARSEVIARALFAGALDGPGDHIEYVDPHSNFFLIRRDFFDYLGGFNENFRGHGSEDFEFFVRLSRYSLQYPMPEHPLEDSFSPRQADFYGPRPYRGFRRLLELMAQPAELAGLRIAHLYHPRGRDQSGWYENNDWDRGEFGRQVTPFLGNRAALLKYDWMPRPKKALVLLKHDAHADMFFPLRLFGYHLITARSDDLDSLERATKLLEENALDLVVIFNPYMRSHMELRMFFEVARKSDIPTLVVERGALPDSWYYAPDLSYADLDFQHLNLSELTPSSEELAFARDYVVRLCEGAATLEANGSFAETLARRRIYRLAFKKICLIPLQLEDDVAVTRFANDHQPYPEFAAQVSQVAAEFPDVLFLVKAHPLSSTKLDLAADNLVCCTEDDNIHALIELSDAVVCYNSGVGLLALVHHKRLVTVGNAFYNLPGLGKRAPDLFSAVASAMDPEGADFHAVPVERLVAWLLFHKYSFFRGESAVRDVGTRKLHGYKNVLWYQLNLPGQSTRSAMRVALSRRPGSRSYVAARLGIGPDLHNLANGTSGASEKANAKRVAPPKGKQSGGPQSSPVRSKQIKVQPAGHAKLRKLVRDPRRFMSDSRFSTLRWIARRIEAGDAP